MRQRIHDHDAVLDRWAAGEMQGEIAKATGIKTHAVRAIVRQNRAKGDPRAVLRPGPPKAESMPDDGREGWTRGRLAEAERLFHKGHSARQIAEAVGGGLTKNAVIGMMQRRQWGGPKPPRPKRQNDVGALANKIAAGSIRKKRGNPNGGLAFKAADRTLAQKPAIAFREPEPVHVPYTGPRYGMMDKRLKDDMCRAIVEGRDVDTLFCSAPVVEGSKFRFCRDHAAVYLTRPTGRTWTPERRQKMVLANLRKAREEA